jgi:hypothetical protein
VTLAWSETDGRRTDIDVGDDEIAEARWFADPPDAFHDFLEDRVAEWADRQAD